MLQNSGFSLHFSESNKNNRHKTAIRLCGKTCLIFERFVVVGMLTFHSPLSRNSLVEMTLLKIGFCPANIYLFKVNNRNTRKRCEICSRLNQNDVWRWLWIVDFEQVNVSCLVTAKVQISFSSSLLVLIFFMKDNWLILINITNIRIFYFRKCFCPKTKQ